MKPVLYSFPKTGRESFSVQIEDDIPHFYDVLHYHPEWQITLIKESVGTRFIGDSIERFSAGDIFMIGPNLPHVFRNDKTFYEEGSDLRASFVSMYLNDSSFGTEFFHLPETRHLRLLMKKAFRGIRVMGETRKKAATLIEQVVNTEGFDRFLALLSLLNCLATSNELDYISNMSFYRPQKEIDSKKINDVFDFVMKNFSKTITLEEVATVASMTPTSFSRYFRQRTQKTFSNFLNEVRIGHACKLLLEGDYNVSEISYECGYNNISNFNRQFKAMTKFTPSEYLKRYKAQNLM